MTVARPPAEVFSWLLDEDKVPRWTTRLEAYELIGDGPIGAGSHVRQVLTVRGKPLEVDLVVTRHAPPHAAESRFSLQGVDVVTAYRLIDAPGGGTELTQTLEGRADGFKARMLLPVVQPHLEGKVKDDLERLRQVLAA